jgi:UDP-N-acetylmuramyl pentapeptide phosphotransferase/UDP-N-acetylglucosamine-1-phosphate transferase
VCSSSRAVSNAINIIDGFNGLASMCVLMMVASIAYVAFQVGDSFVVTPADHDRRGARVLRLELPGRPDLPR